MGLSRTRSNKADMGRKKVMKRNIVKLVKKIVKKPNCEN